jgi:hypothetical protein
VASRWVPWGSAQLRPPGNEGPASVATGAPSTSPPAQRAQAKWRGREIVRSYLRYEAPERYLSEGLGGEAGGAQETYLTRAAFRSLGGPDQLRHSL